MRLHRRKLFILTFSISSHPLPSGLLSPLFSSRLFFFSPLSSSMSFVLASDTSNPFSFEHSTVSLPYDSRLPMLLCVTHKFFFPHLFHPLPLLSFFLSICSALRSWTDKLERENSKNKRKGQGENPPRKRSKARLCRLTTRKGQPSPQRNQASEWHT